MTMWRWGWNSRGGGEGPSGRGKRKIFWPRSTPKRFRMNHWMAATKRGASLTSHYPSASKRGEWLLLSRKRKKENTEIDSSRRSMLGTPSVSRIVPHRTAWSTLSEKKPQSTETGWKSSARGPIRWFRTKYSNLRPISPALRRSPCSLWLKIETKVESKFGMMTVGPGAWVYDPLLYLFREW